MISFDDELSKITGIAFNEISGGFKATIINLNTVVVEGRFSLLNFFESEIQFKVKHGLLKVIGEALKIKKINKELAVISGRVLNITMESKHGKV